MALATTGITTSAVGNALGVSTRDVGALCTSANINKWSIWKPIKYASNNGITLDIIKSVKCGLTPKTSTILYNSSFGNDSVSQVTTTTAATVSGITEWTYTKPSGGSTSPYRLGDFRGYNHSAVATDSGWSNPTFKIDTLNSFVNTNVTSTGTSYAWQINTIHSYFNNFSFRVGESSWHNINNANGNYLPLNYVVGDTINTTEYWRLGIAVYVPSLQKWDYFVSSRPFNAITATTETGYYFPNMFTNTVLLSRLITAYNGGTKTFTCVPVLIKNCYLSKTALSSGAYQSQIKLNSESAVYTMPSGQKSFTMTITADTVDVNNVNASVITYDTNKKYAFCVIYSGQYAGSGSNQKPVQGIAILPVNGTITNGTVYAKFNYTYFKTVTDTAATTASYNGSTTFSTTGTNTFNFGNNSFVGKMLFSGIAASVVKSAVTEFTVS